MKVITCSEARRSFNKLLDAARKEKVFIKGRGGETFCLHYEPSPKSPFDVPGITTSATTDSILAVVKESRSANTES